MILAAEAATSATTPLWVTVLLAVMTPTLTLGGVLWTQHAADRRAERDAELRIEHERERALVERVHTVYDDLVTKANALTVAAADRTDSGDYFSQLADFDATVNRALALGELSVAGTAMAVSRAAHKIRELAKAEGTPDRMLVREAARGLAGKREALASAIRRELSVRPIPPRRGK